MGGHGGTPIMQKSQSPALIVRPRSRGCLTRPLQVACSSKRTFLNQRPSLGQAMTAARKGAYAGTEQEQEKGSPFRGCALELDGLATTPTPSRPAPNGLIQIVHAMMLMLMMIYFRPPASKAFAPGYWPGRRQLCFQLLCRGSA
jgi:hypothetical protein